MCGQKQHYVPSGRIILRVDTGRQCWVIGNRVTTHYWNGHVYCVFCRCANMETDDGLRDPFLQVSTRLQRLAVVTLVRSPGPARRTARDTTFMAVDVCIITMHYA